MAHSKVNPENKGTERDRGPGEQAGVRGDSKVNPENKGTESVCSICSCCTRGSRIARLIPKTRELKGI